MESVSKLARVLEAVSLVFAGDLDLTARWFKAKNPMLGGISPRDMVRMGRLDRLELFVKQAGNVE